MGFILFLESGLKVGFLFFLIQNISVFLFLEFWHALHPIWSWWCLIQDWFFSTLLLLMEGASTSALGLLPIIWLLSSSPWSGDSLGLLYVTPYPLLYPSGHQVQTSVSFHSDLDLLLWDWPTLSLLMVILWRLANLNTGYSRNSLFLSSQWETTWQLSSMKTKEILQNSGFKETIYLVCPKRKQLARLWLEESSVKRRETWRSRLIIIIDPNYLLDYHFESFSYKKLSSMVNSAEKFFVFFVLFLFFDLK